MLKHYKIIYGIICTVAVLILMLFIVDALTVTPIEEIESIIKKATNEIEARRFDYCMSLISSQYRDEHHIDLEGFKNNILTHLEGFNKINIDHERINIIEESNGDYIAYLNTTIEYERPDFPRKLKTHSEYILLFHKDSGLWKIKNIKTEE